MRFDRIFVGITFLLFVASAPLRVLAGQAKVEEFSDGVRKTDPLKPEDERKAFHLPPGFEIQLVASEPDINKPININFDAAGRLWVTSTVEYPYPAKDPSKARDSIKVLSDFDANGKARKIVTFAEGLNIPIGVIPYGKGAIGHSIPFISYYQDTTGAGKSDTKTVLLDRIGYLKDTHGMSGNFVRGFDGWIYATHGFNNDSTIKALDGSQIVVNSGNTYRFRPDGSHIEQFTWGQVNPFGLCFDALGNLYSCDCHTLPIYQLLRGAYYPSFGKKDDGLGFGPTSMSHLHGSTANCGIVVYSDDRFPEEFRHCVFTGNVMTSKINLDELTDTGTTRTANERPDFMSSDDPWFRPTSIQLGPDGALYCTDFYNKIIGHYEVPLTHPGRDRERGRIWRIVYKGTPERPVADKLPPDLTTKSLDELAALTGENNLTLRMFAMHQIVDRLGAKAVEPLKAILKSGSPNQKVCGMWALFNLKNLSAAELQALAGDGDRTVRTHAMRAFAETAIWNDEQYALVRNALKDADPWVRRGAADALGRHAGAENVRPLIALRQSIEAADTHSTHVVRMALRNQVLEKGMSEKIAALKLDEKEMQVLADVCLGAASEDAAAILVKYLASAKEASKDSAKYLEHAIKYLPFGELDALVASARARLGNDVAQQLGLLKSIHDGAAKRGMALSPAVRAWAVETIGKVLSENVDIREPEWTALTLDGKPNAANPWVAQSRPSADGKTGTYLSSLPKGETLTGIYRSKAFEVPEKLTFFMAGHNGNPTTGTPAPKNFIRLREAGTNELLMEAIPPRNDMAQKFSWDLKKFAGKKGVIELVDGDTAGAYAWLAIGRFVPGVVELPADGVSVAQRIQSAIEIAGALKLNEAEGRIAEILGEKKFGDGARSAAAAALGAMGAGKFDAGLAAVLRNAAESVALRESAAGALGGTTNADAIAALSEALQTAPEKSQNKLALTLCGTLSGAESLLKTIEAGKASPRLLLNRAVADQLSSLKIEDVKGKIEKLTKGIPPANEQIQKLIDARVKAYRADKSSAELGAKVFEKNCMACHQLEGKGKVIGPQLDGIGARGMERIVEDILDPSRNVDAAFRVSSVKLASGQHYTGLKRREEGEQIVFADSKGEETSIDKKEIKEIRETANSLMPDGMAEVIAPADFNHLLGYLLSKTGKK